MNNRNMINVHAPHTK